MPGETTDRFANIYLLPATQQQQTGEPVTIQGSQPPAVFEADGNLQHFEALGDAIQEARQRNQHFTDFGQPVTAHEEICDETLPGGLHCVHKTIMPQASSMFFPQGMTVATVKFTPVTSVQTSS